MYVTIILLCIFHLSQVLLSFYILNISYFIDDRNLFFEILSLQDNLSGSYSPINELDQPFQLVCSYFDRNVYDITLVLVQADIRLYKKVIPIMNNYFLFSLIIDFI